MISTTSASSGSPATMVATSSTASLHSMLDQLSFTAEIPNEHYQNSEEGSPLLLWNGLLCFQLDDEDDQPFFDALQYEEPPDVTISSSSSSSSSHDSAHPQKPPSSMAAVTLLRGGDEGSSFGESPTEPYYSQPSGGQASQGGFIPPPPLSPPTQEAPMIHPQQHQPHQPQVSAPPLHEQYQYQQEEGPPQQAHQDSPFAPLPPPLPPRDLPDRFLRAGKGDPVEGQRRYEATLKWRQENGMDTILTEAHPDFAFIKQHYPHYFHLTGRNGEPVFFEQPPKTNLKALKDGGITLEGLLRHYAMVTDYGWQCVSRSDQARSITILDLEGMRMRDFVGDCVEYVRKCSAFTGQHYPERAGFVFVINVPGWFAMIWNVVKPMVDEVTLQKIHILRGKEEIFQALLEKIPIEHIPPEYGGQSMPLGQSPEEHHLRAWMQHNLQLAHGDYRCGGRACHPPCPFCSFVPARSY